MVKFKLSSKFFIPLGIVVLVIDFLLLKYRWWALGSLTDFSMWYENIGILIWVVKWILIIISTLLTLYLSYQIFIYLKKILNHLHTIFNPFIQIFETIAKRKIKFIIINLIIGVLFIFCIIIIHFGRSNVYISLWMYFSSFYFISLLITKISSRWKNSDVRLSYWATFVGIILVELFLRYGTTAYRSYSENNGNLWFVDPFKQDKMDSYNNWKNNNDAGINMYRKNTSRTIKNREFYYTHQYNNLGARGKDVKIDDKKNLIIGIGDSFTEGVGSSEDSTWLYLTTKYLNENNNAFQLLNFGKAGSDIIFEAYKLKKRLLHEFRPKIVIIGLNSSDINDIIYQGGQERFVNNKTLRYSNGPWWMPVYSFSFIFRAVIHNVFKVDLNYFTKKQNQEKTLYSKTQIKNTIDNELIPLANKYKFTLIIAFQASQYDIKNGLQLQSVYDDLVVNNSNVFKLSFLPVVNQIPKDKLSYYFWKYDLHCTSKGYDLWAKRTAFYIDSLIDIGKLQ